jgi:glucose-1-phosphate thymidylyltransferase
MVYESNAEGARPRAIGEFALEAIAVAGATRCLVVVAPWKLDVLGYFGDGTAVGLDLAYLYQEEALGLPNAVDLAYPWLRDADVAFAMPDTLFRPPDALARLRRLYVAERADLALAVFPTDQAERLGPVTLDGDRICAVFDKRPRPPTRNTWGAAIWGPRFFDLFHAELSAYDSGSEPVIGDYFDRAVHAGLRVRGLYLAEGWFEDAGTTEGIARCLNGSPGIAGVGAAA